MVGSNRWALAFWLRGQSVTVPAQFPSTCIQGPQRLTYRFNTTGSPNTDAFNTIGTTIFVKGSKRRALYGNACPFVAA